MDAGHRNECNIDALIAIVVVRELVEKVVGPYLYAIGQVLLSGLPSFRWFPRGSYYCKHAWCFAGHRLLIIDPENAVESRCDFSIFALASRLV